MTAPTLTEFILARIAEDEARLDIPDWYCTDSARGEGWGSRGDECPECGAYMFDGTESGTEDGWGEHMADRHGRILAECEAKRSVIEAAWGDHLQIEGEWGHGKGSDQLEAENDQPDIVKHLAAVYSDHPDYDEAWRA